MALKGARIQWLPLRSSSQICDEHVHKPEPPEELLGSIWQSRSQVKVAEGSMCRCLCLTATRVSPQVVQICRSTPVYNPPPPPPPPPPHVFSALHVSLFGHADVCKQQVFQLEPGIVELEPLKGRSADEPIPLDCLSDY